jgi:hypothetical protein
MVRHHTWSSTSLFAGRPLLANWSQSSVSQTILNYPVFLVRCHLLGLLYLFPCPSNLKLRKNTNILCYDRLLTCLGTVMCWPRVVHKVLWFGYVLVPRVVDLRGPTCISLEAQIEVKGLSHKLIIVRFQVLTAASMKLRNFWDVLLCS